MKDLNIGGYDSDNDHSDRSIHKEEVNSLKIDKLSNRVTIISIIIPCLIAAILFFAYLNMQETVIDVNTEKQTKVLEVTKQFEKRSNALDVKVAKIEALLDKKIPQFESTIAKVEAGLAKIASKKADKASLSKSVASLKTEISKAKKLSASTNKITKENKLLIDSTSAKLKENLSAVDERISSQSDKMDEYETLVATTLKNLSILEKRFDEFKKDALGKNLLEKELQSLNREFDKKLNEIKKEKSKPAASTTSKPVKSTEPEKTIKEDGSIVEEVIIE